MAKQKSIKKRIPYKKTPYKRWHLAGVRRHMTLRHKILMYVTTLSVAGYVVWRIFFTLPLQFGVLSVVLSILLLLAELASFTVTLSNFREATHYVNPDCPEIPDSWYPDVDVYITTHNESVDLMYKTVNSCTFLEYPDKSKVHVWLCDDGDRAEMKALAEELGVGYFSMTGNKHAKAGNLNNAFWQTSSPLVATMDADMVVSSDFLMRTVPYFCLPYVQKQEDGSWRILDKDEVDPEYRIGFVQSPQSFYNPDLFQFNLYSEQNIPNEQDFFFTEVNVAKNNDNVSSYAGSNTLLSRQALVDIDGFATESITEDFLTGLMILQAGYRNLGIPEQLAHGLSPDTIKSLMAQRERWTRGNIQVFKLLRVWTTRTLNFWQKFELTGSLCYWFSFAGRLMFLLAPVMSALFDIRIVDAPVWQTLLFWLPHYILYYFATRVFSDNTRSNHWSAVVDTIMAPYLTAPAFLELLGFSQKKFVVTDKSKGAEPPRWRTMLYTVPHTVILIATIISIFLLVRQSIIINTLYNPIVLFWLFAGAKNLLFAIFFMAGRPNVRSAERFFVRLPVEVECRGIHYNGYTVDISDGGLAAVFETPLNCKSDDVVGLTVQTELYSARMECRVANARQLGASEGGHWKYGFILEKADDENMRQYMQILYDRPHSLAKRFKHNASVFDDINTNLMLRTRRKVYNVRKLPRLVMDLPFETREKANGILFDFNFEYARVKVSAELRPTDVLSLSWGEGLDLMLMAKMQDGSHTTLYRIVNSDEILQRPDFVEIMNRWADLQNLPNDQKPTGTGYITEAGWQEAEEEGD
ncbi:glycosyltransferase [Eubacteriales bacterium OttesenSCG-928-N13]|nr:glycosyltransferase [Eubacteriales bacterium OttesenSCG-928-N13]